MTLDENQIASYLKELEVSLLNPENFQEIRLTNEWASKAPNEAGVYILLEGHQVIYVGETGNLKGRMRDLRDTRNHVLRRTIGHTFYREHEHFTMATSKQKFPEEIEMLVSDHLCKRLKISYLPIALGRKELEELIQSKIPTSIRLNQRGKRLKH